MIIFFQCNNGSYKVNTGEERNENNFDENNNENSYNQYIYNEIQSYEKYPVNVHYQTELQPSSHISGILTQTEAILQGNLEDEPWDLSVKYL